LSVDSATTRFTPARIEAWTTFAAPSTFVLMHSMGLYSAAGTCFSAAAWMTYSTSRNAISRRLTSLTSPMKYRTHLARKASSPSCCISYCFNSSRL